MKEKDPALRHWNSWYAVELSRLAKSTRTLRQPGLSRTAALIGRMWKLFVNAISRLVVANAMKHQQARATAA